MREIKFRAWDKENNIMIGPFEVGSELSMLWPPEMQYTGCKDKNEKEIYECDITIDHIGVGVVKFSERGWKVSYVGHNKGIGKYFANYLDAEWNTFEIIGNIHENLELLEN